jgi:hypothetical protein
VASHDHAHDEEQDGAFTKAQGNLPASAIPACRLGGSLDQPDTTRLGELLCHWQLKSLLFVYPILGGKEDTATLDASPETSGLRLEEVE